MSIMIFNVIGAIFFTLLSDVCLQTYAEIYTSTAEIEYLLDTRKMLVEDLYSYIDKEEERLSIIKRYLDLYKREHMKAMNNISNYVGSPISVFILIKSLTIDLKYVKSKITIGIDIINNVTIKHTSASYPSSEDLRDAAQGLSRLKKMYKLDVKDLAEGKLNCARVSSPLSASDCYELGRVLYKAKDYEIGRAFMVQAYRKYNQEQNSYPFTDIDILEHIGFGSYILGDLRYGKEWIEKILQIDPNHERAKFSKTFFQNEIRNYHGLKEETNIVSGNKNHYHKHVKQRDDNLTQKFEELCRGQMDVSLEVSRRLTCSYLTDNHPFLKIAPIKMEMKHLSPDLVLFHDMLSDKEIETVGRLVKPRLNRSRVFDENTGQMYVQEGLRTSNTAPIYDKESDILFRLSQRVMDMTGLSIENTKSRRVANYGVGGIYEPHYDFSKVAPNMCTKLAGGRIATIMVYLSDVAQGGATVFPKLGVRISPVKSTALFWYNLHPSGEENHAVQHGACPVLQGSKWLFVRTLYPTGQELCKPCNLENQEDGFAGFNPRPELKETSFYMLVGIIMILNTLRGISFILVFNLIYAEFYTALDEVGDLLETRKRVINDVYIYIKTESNILSILKRYLDLFKSEYEMASKGISNYLENPLNAFVLIKRLATDLKYVKNLIKTGTENINNVTTKHENIKYPTLEDLIGAVKGLMTLEEVYKLDIREMAKGKLNGFVYSTAMTASDCYELARILFNTLDPESAITWMEEALRKYYEEKFPYLFTDVDIMEFISYGNYMLEDPITALHWTKKILNIEPNHSRSRNNLIRFQKEIDEQETKPNEHTEVEEESFKQETEKDIETQMEDVKNDPNSAETYQAICRGDIGVPVQIYSRLTCRYLTENHPFLKIAPFKIETIYVNPDIILFYEVLSDVEINSMKELAKPRLRRAIVQDHLTGQSVPSDDRISKSATIVDKYSDILGLVSRRAMHMTGLSMEKTEEIQIANYGIGGYYLPHHDFIHVNNNTYMKGGRRIATVLFYLSGVSRGGDTVFPYLGVSVPPIKGTALFWYNLYSSGEANHAMLHAGCPILRGSKWVATKWILQGGQEFIKPCNLKHQQEGINDKILSPILKATRERRLFEEYQKGPLSEAKKLPQNQEDIEVWDE